MILKQKKQCDKWPAAFYQYPWTAFGLYTQIPSCSSSTLHSYPHTLLNQHNQLKESANTHLFMTLHTQERSHRSHIWKGTQCYALTFHLSLQFYLNKNSHCHLYHLLIHMLKCLKISYKLDTLNVSKFSIQWGKKEKIWEKEQSFLPLSKVFRILPIPGWQGLNSAVITCCTFQISLFVNADMSFPWRPLVYEFQE